MNLSTSDDTNKTNYYNDEPHVHTIDDFLDYDTCLHFIQIASGKLKQALVSHGQKGEVSQGRTGKNCWISHSHDDITLNVATKIANHVGLPLVNAESYQIIYYDKNQEYRNHCDSWPHDGSEKSRRCMRLGGQRMITALCYLNNVKKGGNTRFTRLKIDVTPKAGRLLVFHNVYKDSNKRHPMSEHAGCPVEEGEKWAFNLWFREDNFKKIVYDPPRNKNLNITYKAVNEDGKDVVITNLTKINIGASYNPIIKSYDNVLVNEDLELLKKDLTFEDDTKKSTTWLPSGNHIRLLQKIARITGEPIDHFETIQAVQYPGGFTHKPHFDAYDSSLPESRILKEKMGQRCKTISFFIEKGINYFFIKTCLSYTPEPMSLLVYENVKPGSNMREASVRKQITNLSNKPLVVFHIYVRERSRKSSYVYKPPSKKTETTETTKAYVLGDGKTETTVNPKEIKLEEATKTLEPINYISHLNETYKQFQDDTISKNGHKSLSFCNIRMGWDDIKNVISKFSEIRDETTGILNTNLLNKDYKFDEFTPVIVNNVFMPKAVDYISEYYHKGINAEQFPFGDRQSKRFKTRNDPIARVLHYEMLPLIEKITGEKLKPTYTYLSCYIKGSDLPQHTDNPDCWRTVSYLIDKPNGTNWDIYVDLRKQNVKHKGRYSDTPIPSKDNCVACDCDKGGMMMFDGTDHIHYRETLKHEYYYLLLLHYKPIDC